MLVLSGRNGALVSALLGLAICAAPLMCQELKTDDGRPDGTSVLEDGLLVVNRLTPPSYPVVLKTIRVYFVEFQDEPVPTGETVRLVAFLDPSGAGRPPQNLSFLVDERVKVPRTGEFVDFPVSGPTVLSGDLYVGYQAPSPARGVGFAADTTGEPQRRGYFSRDGGATFLGPLQFGDGAEVNVLIRAVVEGGSGGDELRVDDGTVEVGVVRDGGLYVNRLTPPRYPATLRKVRVQFVEYQDEPSPVGRTVKLLAFADPQGSGSPPEKPRLVTRDAAITATDRFLEFDIDGPTISSGDFYVGYQAPDPARGVGFAMDINGTPRERTFRSRDGGETFSGPIELIVDDGRTVPANLFVRAVVETRAAPQGDFQLEATRGALDLSGGATAEFQVSVAGTSEFRDTVALEAALDPADPRIQVTVTEPQAAPGRRVTVRVAAEPGLAARSYKLKITGRCSSLVRERTVMLDAWEALASETVDASGKRIAADGFELTVPPGAIAGSATVRVLRGTPSAAGEERVSGAYRVTGLPDDLKAPLTLRMIAAPKDALDVRAAAPPTHFAIQTTAFAKSAAANIPVSHLVPAPATSDGTLALPPPKVAWKIKNTFTIWAVTGYASLRSAKGTFEIVYPSELRFAAEMIAGWLDDSELRLGLLGLNLKGRSINVEIKPLTDYLFWANKDIMGYAEGEKLVFNSRRLGTTAQVVAFKPTVAHELMHVFQAVYGGAARDAAWYWMDEATAVWFETLAMNDPSYISSVVRPSSGSDSSDNYLTFLPHGLNYNVGGKEEQEHGYGASMFLSYLSRTTSDGAVAKIIELRQEKEKPMDALVAALSQYSSTMTLFWQGFANAYLEGRVYRGASFPDPPLLIPGGGEKRLLLFKTAADAGRVFPLYESPDLSGALYAVMMNQAAATPDLTDGITLALRLDGGEAAQQISTFLVGQKKSAGSTPGDRELLIKEVEKLVAAREILLVLVANGRAVSPYDKKTKITPRIELAAASVKIKSGVPSKGVLNYEYEFNTENVNVPADADYSWTFSDGGTATGRRVKHLYKTAGKHTVRVRVSSNKLARAVDASVEVEIAAATNEKKGEVNFWVYRKVRGPVGASNQSCQNFSITIMDSAGRVLDGGSSVARNGAFEIVLPFGTGYQYRVSYAYTTPCPDSGQRTGSFDVKDAIGAVSVETPPCEYR